MILDLPRPPKGYPFDPPKGEVAMSIEKERKNNGIGPPDKHEEANESEEIDLTGPYVPEEKPSEIEEIWPASSLPWALQPPVWGGIGQL